MQVLVPYSSSGEGWQAQLARIRELPPFQPFAPELIKFVERVSRGILSDARMRPIPEMVALAYWFRRANILNIKDRFCVERDGRLWLPRGTVVHFAPANVDTIFAYSWLLSLLAGNKNIVRMSSRYGSGGAMLLEVLNGCLGNPAFDAIRERNLVVCYERDEQITNALCSSCQVRVIWGGNDTIAQVRQIPISPLATELAFADRFSFAVLNATAVALEPEPEFNKLVRNFVADSFSLRQMACSSPRMIVWIGTAAMVEQAKQRFWPAVSSYLASRQVQYPAAVTIMRVTAMYAYAAQGIVNRLNSHAAELPARAHLNSDAGNFRDSHCGAGLFLERELGTLRDVLALIQPKDQTMTVFGFERSELQQLARELPNRGIDRIVSIGKSLTFSPVWDGVDLLRAFSREVEIDLEGRQEDGSRTSRETA
jgi:hypothetical protein